MLGTASGFLWGIPVVRHIPEPGSVAHGRWYGGFLIKSWLDFRVFRDSHLGIFDVATGLADRFEVIAAKVENGIGDGVAVVLAQVDVELDIFLEHGNPFPGSGPSGDVPPGPRAFNGTRRVLPTTAGRG